MKVGPWEPGQAGLMDHTEAKKLADSVNRLESLTVEPAPEGEESSFKVADGNIILYIKGLPDAPAGTVFLASIDRKIQWIPSTVCPS